MFMLSFSFFSSRKDNFYVCINLLFFKKKKNISRQGSLLFKKKEFKKDRYMNQMQVSFKFSFQFTFVYISLIFRCFCSVCLFIILVFASFLSNHFKTFANLNQLYIM